MSGVPGKLAADIKQSRPFPSLEEEAFLNLLRTCDALSALLGTLLSQFELSHPQYNVLRILRGAGRDGLPCGEIGSRMITRDPDITRLIDRLEKRSLTARSREAKDRRVVTVRITKAGLDLLHRLDKPVAEALRKSLGHLGERDLEKLIALLEQARERV
jgi:DNA-binding MarR family transcriptional regulator